MDNDLLTLILEILLMICTIGLCFGVYIWYLDWLWYKTIRKAQRTIYSGIKDPHVTSKVTYRPIWTVEDKEGREIAKLPW